MTLRVLDLFAGAGGFDEGARMAGIPDTVGLEHAWWPCATAQAAGHARIQCDVATYPTAPLARVGVRGLVGSPPCQAWSLAGQRGGELDRAACHELAERMAAGDDSTDWRAWADDRSPLVCQPIRWIRDLRPEWVALEEVPAVLPLWQHFAAILRRWGYSTWVGILNSADYGVAQTRRRAILMASRTRPAVPPPPTHAEGGEDGDLFGAARLPWVSMADALGWGHGDLVYRRTNSRGARGTTVASVPVPTSSPAPTLTGKSGHQWVVRPGETPPVLVNGNQPNAGRRSIDEPAPTVLFGNAHNDVRWVFDRPATTVVSSFRPDVIAAPGYRTEESRQDAVSSVSVSVSEAGVLQSFPPDYPWQGPKTAQYAQVGNAIPPLLAAHIIAVLDGAL